MSFLSRGRGRSRCVIDRLLVPSPIPLLCSPLSPPGAIIYEISDVRLNRCRLIEWIYRTGNERSLNIYLRLGFVCSDESARAFGSQIGQMGSEDLFHALSYASSRRVQHRWSSRFRISFSLDAH